jgi:predicted O-methyltransferase YrrM
MQVADRQFVGSIPALDERHLVPLRFAPHARDMAERLAGMAGGRPLEIAAGAGAMTWVLAESLPPAIEIVASDLDQAMVDCGAGILPTTPIEERIRCHENESSLAARSAPRARKPSRRSGEDRGEDASPDR